MGRSRLSVVFVLALTISVSCAETATVKVGFVAPLTGPSSAVGVGARNGALLFLDSRNGREPRIRLVVKDDGSDRDRCLEAVKSLAAEGCRILLLATTSGASGTALPWALENGILVISPTISHDSLAGRDDLFVRVNNPSSSFGVDLADAAAVRIGSPRFALLGDERNAIYKDVVFSAFSKELVARGGKIVFGLSFRSDQGLPEAEIVEGIRKSKANGVLIVAASSEAVLICKFIERAGLKTAVYLPPWPLTIDLITSGGASVEGAVAASISDLDFSTPEAKAFKEAYRNAYSEEPSFTATFGYETASVLRETLSGLRDFSPAAVKAQILRIGKFQGLQGPIVFDRFCDASRPSYLYVVDGGRFKRLK